MSNLLPPATAKATPSARYYTIHIANYLDADWADWFDGLEIFHAQENASETILAGYLRDQAELFGVLYKLHMLNLTLLSVQGRDSNKE